MTQEQIIILFGAVIALMQAITAAIVVWTHNQTARKLTALAQNGSSLNHLLNENKLQQ